MYQSILLAVDGSDHSIRAAEEAVKLASLNSDAEVTIVFVADHRDAKTEVLHSGSTFELDLQRRRRLQPVEATLEAGNVKHSLKILHGIPGPTIVEFANEGNYDILVIGSRGLNSMQELVIGSVSHKVVKRADCPVLIVK